ncbi:MAG: hypothetical protein JSV88_32290 [Candidatus Aminicenantes bacterium]|nr:MAG: hypothetical protein JSV88_32290 [Candidatus Aminicenantes bacterium]
MKGKLKEGILLVSVLFFISLLFISISGGDKEISTPGEWKALTQIEPNLQAQIIEKAKVFAGIIEIANVTYPKVVSSHTRFVNIFGVNKDKVRVLLGVDPETTEVVKMVKLYPRKVKDAMEVKISKEQAQKKCLNFLKSKNLTISKNYAITEAKVVSLGPWKRWKFVWRHFENDVQILPDFIMMEVNASEEANIISYSKVHHEVMVDLTPKLDSSKALDRAKEFLPGKEGLEIKTSRLSVVYPNHFFKKQVWEWSEKQALCWILEFHQDGRHVIDIWVDAVTGQIQGGYMCHLHVPEVFGIDRPIEKHMQSHLENIWFPYLGMMKYDVSSFDWTNAVPGFTETTISKAISTSRYFIVEGHGDVTDTAEKMIIAYGGAADARAFTPDEVPANNLGFVFLDVCQSGHDGTGPDFKDTFLSQGGDVFIGFDDYMCAWNYEERLLHYLAQGIHLADAHTMAVADVSPVYPIVITYNVSSLNKVRLAPIFVTVKRSPSGNISTRGIFTVSASLYNMEDVDHTAATNVKAKLVLPSKFKILSGANPQNVGTINWNSTKNATWTVKAPGVSGLFTLDVEVWSDNLGVEVDDPDDPYHEFEVNVVGRGRCK